MQIQLNQYGKQLKIKAEQKKIIHYINQIQTRCTFIANCSFYDDNYIINAQNFINKGHSHILQHLHSTA